MKPGAIIDTNGCRRELYKTRQVGTAWGDPLLETLTPYCVLFERGNTGAMVGMPYPAGYLERAQERQELMAKPNRVVNRELLRREISCNGHGVGV